MSQELMDICDYVLAFLGWTGYYRGSSYELADEVAIDLLEEKMQWLRRQLLWQGKQRAKQTPGEVPTSPQQRLKRMLGFVEFATQSEQLPMQVDGLPLGELLLEALQVFSTAEDEPSLFADELERAFSLPAREAQAHKPGRPLTLGLLVGEEPQHLRHSEFLESAEDWLFHLGDCLTAPPLRGTDTVIRGGVLLANRCIQLATNLGVQTLPVFVLRAPNLGRVHRMVYYDGWEQARHDHSKLSPTQRERIALFLSGLIASERTKPEPELELPN